MDLGTRSNITALQWNANGIKGKMMELTVTANKLKLDVIMIQESKLRATDKLPLIPGYSTVRKDRGTDKGGGLITFIKDDLPFTTIDHPTNVPGSLLEYLAIRLNTKANKHLVFANVYCPPTRGEQIGSEFNISEFPTNKDTIIGCDLNIHSYMWDQWQPEDRMGLEVESWMIENDFGIANDGSATRTNAGTGGSSAPDVTIAHNSLLENIEWSIAECMGSDHLPILYTIECHIHTLNPTPITALRWNWGKENLKGFKDHIEVAISEQANLVKEMPLNTRLSFLNSCILNSASIHIGKVKITKNSKGWMSKEIREAVKVRNRLRRQVRTKRREWMEATSTVRTLITESKQNKWKDFLSDASSSSDPNKIWATIKSLSGRSANSIKNEVLIHNTKRYTTSKAKADAFMKRYAAISRLNIEKSERLKKPLRKLLNSPRADEECCKPFSSTELSQAIKSMKSKGAPGKDKIEARFLKSLGEKALELLLSIFNDSWKNGSCPSCWREAIIVPLLKKGKPASEIDSFRPVSLTSCVAKTMQTG